MAAYGGASLGFGLGGAWSGFVGSHGIPEVPGVRPGPWWTPGSSSCSGTTSCLDARVGRTAGDGPTSTSGGLGDLVPDGDADLEQVVPPHAGRSMKSPCCASDFPPSPSSAHRLDFDTTVNAMALTAREMSAKYKETSEGGLAVALVLC